MSQAIEIQSQGLTIRGFLHKPEVNAEKLPLVIMFNGYATEWQFGTKAFIDAFTALGFATLNMDYRYFGASDGEPRQLLDIPEQLNDCRAIIEYALQQRFIDKQKIVLWGSSLGGGHALSMAAEYQLAGVIAQVPHCDSRAAFKTVKLSAVAKGMSQAFLDVLGDKLGKSPRYIPVLAEPSDYAVMNHAGWLEHYLRLAEGSKTWQNAIPARSLLRGSDYRPIGVVDKINCKALIVAGDKDQGVPVDSVKQAVEKIKQAELYLYDGDHFDVYGGAKQALIIDKQLTFLKQLFTL